MGIGLLKIRSFYFRSNKIGLLTLGLLKFGLTVYNQNKYYQINFDHYEVLKGYLSQRFINYFNRLLKIKMK